MELHNPDPAQAWAAIAAAPNLRSQLTQLCLGIAFDKAGDEGGPAFEMPSLTPLAQLQARPGVAGSARTCPCSAFSHQRVTFQPP